MTMPFGNPNVPQKRNEKNKQTNENTKISAFSQVKSQYMLQVQMKQNILIVLSQHGVFCICIQGLLIPIGLYEAAKSRPRLHYA